MSNREELLRSYETGNFLETVYACSLANHNDRSALALELAALHNEGLIDVVGAFESLAHFYTDSDSHGAVLSDVCVDRPKEEFLSQVFGECDQSPHFKEMSAIKFDWWPLVVVACRHHRLPLPLHLLEGLRTR